MVIFKIIRAGAKNENIYNEHIFNNSNQNKAS